MHTFKLCKYTEIWKGVQNKSLIRIWKGIQNKSLIRISITETKQNTSIQNMRTSCIFVYILIFAFFYYSPTVSKSAKNSQKKRNYVIKTNRKQYLVRTGNKRGSFYSAIGLLL